MNTVWIAVRGKSAGTAWPTMASLSELTIRFDANNFYPRSLSNWASRYRGRHSCLKERPNCEIFVQQSPADDIARRREFRLTSVRPRGVGSRSEQCSDGIETEVVSMITIRASPVV